MSHAELHSADRRRSISWKALLAVIFWGLSFILTKVALTWLAPAALVAVRMVIGSITLAGLAFATRQSGSLAVADRPRCILLGAILAAHLLLQNAGLRWTTATNTAWIIGFIPITIAVAARVFLGERIAARGWLGIVVGAIGIGVVLVSSGTNFRLARMGDLLQVTSCFTWTAYTLLAVAPIMRNGSRLITQWSIGVAAIFTIPTTLAGSMTAGPMTGSALLSVVLLGIVCSGIAYWLWYAAVREIGSAATGAYVYVEPVVTWVAARFLQEQFTWWGVAGGLIVLLGVWLVASGKS